jgi:hypothetical protein
LERQSKLQLVAKKENEMETPRIKKGRTRAILLGLLIVGATAYVVGAQSATQNSVAHETANASAVSSVAIVGSEEQNDAPLLDTFDRATAMVGRSANSPVEEMPLLDTFDRATAFHRGHPPAQTGEAPLLDTFDRATAMVGR